MEDVRQRVRLWSATRPFYTDERHGPGKSAQSRGTEAVLSALMLAWDDQRRDRKSTRLNSSHLVISYAVFCLKKKKTKYQNRPSRRHMQQPGATILTSSAMPVTSSLTAHMPPTIALLVCLQLPIASS